MTDFFTKPEPVMDTPIQPAPATPPTVQVGDKQYTQEELTKLVGLGETASEYEKQWNRPIKDFYPDYTQKSQRLAEIERQQQEAEQARLQERAQANQLTPDEQKQLAIRQAKELGIVTNDVLQDMVNQALANGLTGQQLMNESQALVREAKEKGLPSVEVSDLLKYMGGENPTGTHFGTPEKAYNDMFEKEVMAWRQGQLTAIKPQGMVTNDRSSAGGKGMPAPQTITRESLAQAIRESLTRQGNGI